MDTLVDAMHSSPRYHFLFAFLAATLVTGVGAEAYADDCSCRCSRAPAPGGVVSGGVVSGGVVSGGVVSGGVVSAAGVSAAGVLGTTGESWLGLRSGEVSGRGASAVPQAPTVDYRRGQADDLDPFSEPIYWCESDNPLCRPGDLPPSVSLDLASFCGLAQRESADVKLLATDATFSPTRLMAARAGTKARLERPPRS